MSTSADWNPDEWQHHIQLLLKRRYGARYQEIPDKDKGDFGIEGFVRPDGHVYQCYAAEPTSDVTVLYDKQRDKITRDIGKLVKNKDQLAVAFGPMKIHFWVLAVPRYETKRIVTFAGTKAQEVNALGLPFIASDFAIHVIDEDHFRVEAQEIVLAGLRKLNIAPPEPTPQAIADWRNVMTTQLRVLDQKLTAIHNDEGIRSEKIKDLITFVIRGQNALGLLRAAQPELHASVMRCKESREGLLAGATIFEQKEDPATTVKEALQRFRAELAELGNRSLDGQTVELLALEAIGDWLLRCPLKLKAS